MRSVDRNYRRYPPLTETRIFKRHRGNARRMEREPLIQARVNYLRRELDRADLFMCSLRRRQLRQQLMQMPPQIVSG
jgi:hypothetical protein